MIGGSDHQKPRRSLTVLLFVFRKLLEENLNINNTADSRILSFTSKAPSKVPVLAPQLHCCGSVKFFIPIPDLTFPLILDPALLAYLAKYKKSGLKIVESVGTVSCIIGILFHKHTLLETNVSYFFQCCGSAGSRSGTATDPDPGGPK